MVFVRLSTEKGEIAKSALVRRFGAPPACLIRAARHIAVRGISMLAPQEQPDFAAMHAAIAAVGRDAINTVGEPDAGKRLVDQFASAFDNLKDFRATAIKLRIRNKRNTELRIRAHEVRRFAERRLAQLIIVLKNAGIVTDGRALPGYKAGRVPSRLTLKHDFGIDRKDSQDWQRLARMSEEAFLAFVAEETARLRT